MADVIDFGDLKESNKQNKWYFKDFLFLKFIKAEIHGFKEISFAENKILPLKCTGCIVLFWKKQRDKSEAMKYKSGSLLRTVSLGHRDNYMNLYSISVQRDFSFI